MANDLQRARVEAAAEAICDARPHSSGGTLVIYEDAVDFARAALAAADAHLPSVEEVAEVLNKHNPRYDFNTQMSNCACGWKYRNHIEGSHSVHRAKAAHAALFGEVAGDAEEI